MKARKISKRERKAIAVLLAIGYTLNKPVTERKRYKTSKEGGR